MKKFKIVLITILAVVGAILIYNKFNDIDYKTTIPNKIANDYNLIDTDIVYENKSIDEVINLLNNKYSIVFMCTPESNWCQYYAKILNEVALEKDIDKIYYLNIKDERSMNTSKYQKLVDILKDYLHTDDIGNKIIYMPEVVFAYDGRIIAHDNETSIITSEINPSDYWTEENIDNLKNKLKSYIDLLNSDEIYESNETNITIESEE